MGDGIDGLGTESYLWRENKKLRDMVGELKAEVERLRDVVAEQLKYIDSIRAALGEGA